MFQATCIDCETPWRIEHSGPLHPKAVVTIREVCPACGVVNYLLINGEDAYKPRGDTLQLQFKILDFYAEMGPPLTVRQVFYNMSSVRGLVPKDDSGYRKVQQQMVTMRRAGSLPYGWVADNARYFIRSQTYSGLGEALERCRDNYRRDLWAEQDAYVELWVEKDALAGVISPITQRYGVPLYVARGYSSISFAREAALQLANIGKPIYVYHFGDFDYDGVHAAEKIREELEYHGPRFHYERVAITPEQIRRFQLPTRPQKLTSPRRRWFMERYGDVQACELDALPPRELRRLVEQTITQHIDPHEWRRIQQIEAEERRTLDVMLANLDRLWEG